LHIALNKSSRLSYKTFYCGYQYHDVVSCGVQIYKKIFTKVECVCYDKTLCALGKASPLKRSTIGLLLKGSLVVFHEKNALFCPCLTVTNALAYFRCHLK
jgi:hypothetical protein